MSILPASQYHHSRATAVRVLDQEVTFHLEEVGRQVKVEPPKGLVGAAWYHERVQIHPTGDLRFRIDSYGGGLGTTWRDGKQQRLEQLLDDIIAGLVAIGQFEQERAIAREQEARAKAEAEAQRLEEERARQREEARGRYLAEQVATWRFGKEASEFIAALEGRMSVEQDPAKRLLLETWARWARSHVPRIDPLGMPSFGDLERLLGDL